MKLRLLAAFAVGLVMAFGGASKKNEIAEEGGSIEKTSSLIESNREVVAHKPS